MNARHEGWLNGCIWVVTIIGLYAVMWYVVIPFNSRHWAGIHEVDISDYAQVGAMDNAITHEYIVECLEDNIITRSEYAEIRRMLEKYPIIEQITKR